MTSGVAVAVPGAAVREAGSGQTGKAGQDGRAVGAYRLRGRVESCGFCPGHVPSETLMSS